MAEKSQRHGRFGTLWRTLAVAGVLLGLGALFSDPGVFVSARGKPRSAPSAEALEAGHEVHDIDVRRTAYILAGMAGTTALVIGVVFVMVWRFNLTARHAWSGLPPQQTAVIIPPSPHLQRDPFADLADVRARESRVLHSYGWTSTDHSTARIPIARAMTLVVGKSLDASR